MCEFKRMTNQTLSNITHAKNISIRTNTVVRTTSRESISAILDCLPYDDITHSLENNNIHDIHGLTRCGEEYRINVLLC